MAEMYQIIENEDIPTLVTDGGFLSWIRGYRMQVSMTVDGVGCNSSSASTMHHDLRYIDELELSYDKTQLLKSMIVFSHVWEACGNDHLFWSDKKKAFTAIDKLIVDTEESIDSLFPTDYYGTENLFKLVKHGIKKFPNDPLHKVFRLTSTTKDSITHVGTVCASLNLLAARTLHDEMFYILDLKEVFGDDSKHINNTILGRLLFLVEARAGISNKINGYNVNGKSVTVGDVYTRSYNEDGSNNTLEHHLAHSRIARNMKYLK